MIRPNVRLSIILITWALISGTAAITLAGNLAEADHLWQQRDDSGALFRSIDLYQEVLKAAPHDKALLERLAIAYYWKGNSLPEGMWHRKERMAAFETGRKYAARLCALEPESIPGNFWHAVNDISYINELLIKTSKHIIDDAVRRNNLVMQKERYYYQGGPLRLAAKIIWGIPAIVRDENETLENAEKMLKEAIEQFPQFTLSHIFLADIYLAMDRDEDAHKALNQVFTIDENAIPNFAPENRRDKKRARHLIEDHFDS